MTSVVTSVKLRVIYFKLIHVEEFLELPSISKFSKNHKIEIISVVRKLFNPYLR